MMDDGGLYVAIALYDDVRFHGIKVYEVSWPTRVTAMWDIVRIRDYLRNNFVELQAPMNIEVVSWQRFEPQFEAKEYENHPGKY